MIQKLTEILKREHSYYTDTPRSATLELTYRCNLTCRTCGVWKKGFKDIEKELTLPEIFQIIDQIKEFGVERISLLGSEPFMKENIEDIFRYIKKTGLKCFITSNGVLMTPENIRAMIQAEVDRINISIDGVGERHDKIRGVPGTFDKARANVRLLVEEREESGKKKPEITLHSTLSRLNIDQIEPVKKLKDDWRVDHVTFQYMVETPKEKVEETQFNGIRAASHRLSAWNDSLLFRKEEVGHLRQTIRRMRERGEKLDFAMRSLDRWSDENLLTGQVPIKRCYATHNHLLINPFGDLIPCSNIDDLPFGNLRRNSIEEIWNGDKRSEFTRELKQRFFPVCASCANFSMTPGQIFTVVTGGTLQ